MATVNVSDFGAHADNGTTDNTTPFQNAINQCNSDGGGTVTIPSYGIWSRYALNGSLSVPENVSLGSDVEGPADSNSYGATIEVHNEGSAFITNATSNVQTNTNISDLTFWYPNQTNGTTDPIAYPPTIQSSASIRVKRCLFVNSYSAIVLNNAGRSVVSDCNIGSFNVGIQADSCYDVVRINRTHIWPFFDVGAQYPSEADIWSCSHSIGMNFLRCDDVQMSDSYIFGKWVGIGLGDSPNSQPGGLKSSCGMASNIGIDACQPPGTIISTPAGICKIEDLIVGDLVIGFRSDTQRFRTKGSTVTGITKRFFEGELIKVETSTSSSRYTPEHRCWAKLEPAIRNKFIVYLMKHGDRYRVGVTAARMGNFGGRCGLGSRMSVEGGEAIWILDVKESRSDAHLLEEYVSCFFGIPQMCFKEPIRKQSIDHGILGGQDRIDMFWELMGDLTPNAIRCLNHFGRDIRFPIATPGQQIIQGAHIIRACNLLDGMLVLNKEDSFRGRESITSNNPNWSKIICNREPYIGDVYSLAIEPYQMYVADGIVTHNCQWGIYASSTQDNGWNFNNLYLAMSAPPTVNNGKSVGGVAFIAGGSSEPILQVNGGWVGGPNTGGIVFVQNNCAHYWRSSNWLGYQ